MAHIGQARPDSGRGFQIKVLELFQVVVFLVRQQYLNLIVAHVDVGELAALRNARLHVRQMVEAHIHFLQLHGRMQCFIQCIASQHFSFVQYIATPTP